MSMNGLKSDAESSEALSIRNVLKWVGRIFSLLLIIILAFVLMFGLMKFLPFWLAFITLIAVTVGSIYWIWRKDQTFSIISIVVTLGIFISVFLVPLSVPNLEPLSVTPEQIILSKGEEMALFHVAPNEKVSEIPIVFVHGGPGGPTTEAPLKLMKDLANDLGRDVYTYDHYSAGRSSFDNADMALINIDEEARRLNEIINRVGTQADGTVQATIFGHSYAGALIGRYLAWYPGSIDKFVALDTSPLYSLGTGNLKDRPIYDSELESILLESKAKEDEEVANINVRGVLGAVFQHLSLHEITRGAFLLGPSFFEGITFGSNPEASYMLEKAFFNVISGYGRYGEVPEFSFQGVSFAAQGVNASILESDDYSATLMAVETPSVLMVHPEKGDVPWAIHKDYENFFSSVDFVLIDEGTHSSIYGDDLPPAQQTYQYILSFLRNEPIEDVYTGFEDPYK